MGPGLSWPQLVAAADNALPGGSTADPHARLLLLLPAFGDDEVPDDAVARLADALRARTSVEDPGPLAAVLLEDQGAPGPARWTSAEHGFSVNMARTLSATPSTALRFCRSSGPRGQRAGTVTRTLQFTTVSGVFVPSSRDCCVHGYAASVDYPIDRAEPSVLQQN
jgi:hypothetical protein